MKRLLSAESYLVSGESLNAIGLIDTQKQFELAKVIQAESKGKLKQVILQSYMNFGGDAQWKYVYDAYTNGNPTYTKEGILAIKEIVTAERNLSIAPRTILFLNEIKPYKETLKDTAAIVAINKSIAEINQVVKDY